MMMRNRASFISTCLALTISGMAHAGEPARHVPARPAALAASDKAAASVRRLLADYDRPGRPGIAVGVYRHGRVVLTATAGYADLEHRVKVTPETRFELASVSKQFTGYAITRLARDGRIDLDADIRTYLPWVPGFGGAKITARQLLHHTSGIKEQHELCMLAGFDCEHLNDRQQFINVVKRQTMLNFTPGSRVTYCNTGYMLLGEIVKAVTGKTLRQYADEVIFKPLDMTSFYLDEIDEVIPNRGIGYMKLPGGGWSRGLTLGSSVGEAGVQATIGDMMKWIDNYSRTRIGDVALMKEFTKPGLLNDGTVSLYGAGIGLEDVLGRRALSHAGGLMGNVTNLVYFPEEDLGIVVLMLDGSWDAPRISDKIAEIYLGRKPATSVETPVAPDPVVAKSLAGRFLLSEASWPGGEQIHILQRGAAFYIDTALEQAQGKAKETKLVFRKDGSFDEEGSDENNFRPIVEDGQVVALTRKGDVEQPGQLLRYSRFTPVNPTPEQLSTYAGRYCSDELEICYSISGDRTDLLASSIATDRAICLSPVVGDRFDSDSWFFSKAEFVRRGNEITGVNVSSARARNSLFVKR